MDLRLKNESFISEVERSLAENSSLRFSAGLSDATYSGAESFLKFTGLYKIDYPKIFTVTMHAGSILDAIKESTESLCDLKERMYSHMVSRTEARIDYLNSMLEGEQAERLFFEKPADYLAARGALPEPSASYRSSDGREYRFETRLLNLLPILVLVDAEGDVAYLLDMPGFDSQMQNQEKPLRLRVELSRLTDGGRADIIDGGITFAEGRIEIADEAGRFRLILDKK